MRKVQEVQARCPPGGQTVNQSTLPTSKKQLWAQLCPHHHSVTRPNQAQSPPHPLLSPPPPREIHTTITITVFPQFLSVLVSTESHSQKPPLLIRRRSNLRSAECDAWKLEAAGVTHTSERVHFFVSLSFIARRTEFTNRIRGDYDTDISQLLSFKVEPTHCHSTCDSCSKKCTLTLSPESSERKLSCPDWNMTWGMQYGPWTIAQLLHSHVFLPSAPTVRRAFITWISHRSDI